MDNMFASSIGPLIKMFKTFTIISNTLKGNRHNVLTDILKGILNALYLHIGV